MDRVSRIHFDVGFDLGVFVVAANEPSQFFRHGPFSGIFVGKPRSPVFDDPISGNFAGIHVQDGRIGCGDAAGSDSSRRSEPSVKGAEAGLGHFGQFVEEKQLVCLSSPFPYIRELAELGVVDYGIVGESGLELGYDSAMRFEHIFHSLSNLGHLSKLASEHDSVGARNIKSDECQQIALASAC